MAPQLMQWIAKTLAASDDTDIKLIGLRLSIRLTRLGVLAPSKAGLRRALEDWAPYALTVDHGTGELLINVAEATSALRLTEDEVVGAFVETGIARPIGDDSAGSQGIRH